MRTLIVFGTRPEAIKMAPVVAALSEDSRFAVEVCVTAQHREMLDQVLSFFAIEPAYDLDLMQPDQGIGEVTARVVTNMEPVLRQARPDVMLVQGDTTTSFAAALAAYYAKVRVGHVEAGLRTGDRYSPYPEEMNRMLTGRLADYHFPPTERARQNLMREGVCDESICVTGNTVVDALLVARQKVESWRPEAVEGLPPLDWSRRLVLITAHRRESFGEGLDDVFRSIAELARANDDVNFVFPVHPNPNVRGPATRILEDAANVYLIDPVDYPLLVWLMSRSYLILTDSGGIQEEAPSLGVPVLVMREKTERPEGVEVGAVKLVGTDPAAIVGEASALLKGGPEYQRMSRAGNPYGDGRAAERIRDFLGERLVA
ncbi:MAG: UDP-N-acetylglucosamine 2-epimerase (non-hydrolyzing) [Dehalococcoidia bacterium]